MQIRKHSEATACFSSVEQPLNVLMLAGPMAPWSDGEMARHSATLVRHLGPFCSELLVVYDGPEEQVVRRMLGLGGNVRLVQVASAGIGVKAWSEAARQTIKGIEFDAIYAQGLTGWAFRDAPHLVVNLHGMEIFGPVRGLRRHLDSISSRKAARLLLQSAHTVITAGGALVELLLNLGVDPSRITTIPSGLPSDWLTARPTPRMAGPLRALYIGRSDVAHGYDLLARSLHDLSQPIALDAVGPLHPFHPGRHDVTFHGEVRSRERMRALIDGADVLVVPSRTVARTDLILGALARGRHVIATPVGATAPLLAELPSCPLIAPSARALTAALAAFAAAPPEPERFNLSRFTWARIAMDHARVFQRIAAERSVT